MDKLLNPPFAANPPVKLNINAKTLGLVLLIIGALVVLLDLFGLFAAFSFCSGLNSLYGTCNLPILLVIGELVSLASAVLVALGGWRMYQGNAQGKEWVIYGLILRVVAAVLTLIGNITAYSGLIGVGVGGAAVFGLIFGLILTFVVYYLVVISRFPGEANVNAYTAPPASGGWGGGPSAPPPPPL